MLHLCISVSKSVDACWSRPIRLQYYVLVYCQGYRTYGVGAAASCQLMLMSNQAEAYVNLCVEGRRHPINAAPVHTACWTGPGLYYSIDIVMEGPLLSETRLLVNDNGYHLHCRSHNHSISSNSYPYHCLSGYFFVTS